MKPDKKTIDALIRGIERYNKAKSAKEGFGALGALIETGEKQLSKRGEIEWKLNYK